MRITKTLMALILMTAASVAMANGEPAPTSKCNAKSAAQMLDATSAATVAAIGNATGTKPSVTSTVNGNK
jgi:hypothetical protein